MNKVQIMGRLTRDPEIKTLQNDLSVCSNTLAVDRKKKREDGSREADFIPVVFWRQQADFVAKYFTKGSRIAVTGHIQVRSYEDTEGKKRNAFEVVAEEVFFADSKQGGTQEATGASGYQTTDYKPKFDSPKVTAADNGFIPMPDDDISLPFDLDP